MGKLYSYIIASNHIFDSISDTTYPGYICIKGQKIVKVESGSVSLHDMEEAENIIKFEDELIMPGLIDTHTFFTGYAVFHVGADFSNVASSEEAVNVINRHIEKKHSKLVLGHGWNPNKLCREEGRRTLENTYPNIPIIVFSSDRGDCIMNSIAENIYRFNSESCFPESYYRIMETYLNDRDFIDDELSGYVAMMNSRGVTSVKEMGFDDFYGFSDILKEKEESLKLRFFFMSQPVSRPMDLEYAKAMREKFTGDKVRFSGFNRMTDGTIASMRGYLKEPYKNQNVNCIMDIDWNEIEKDVLNADREGFRWSLHCQGNGAVEKATDIFSKCIMENGRLKNRHAITDMEYSDSDDLKRLGKMGVCAELYFQIMGLDSGDLIIENIKRTIGEERGKMYWNRREMLNSGMILSGATDLPLMITSLQESIYYSCFGKLDNGKTFQPDNTISICDMMKAWTYGGAKNISMEDKVGTLEAGKLADIAVFSKDFTQLNEYECLKVKNVMTIFDGNIVYKID